MDTSNRGLEAFAFCHAIVQHFETNGLSHEIDFDHEKSFVPGECWPSMEESNKTGLKVLDSGIQYTTKLVGPLDVICHINIQSRLTIKGLTYIDTESFTLLETTKWGQKGKHRKMWNVLSLVEVDGRFELHWFNCVRHPPILEKAVSWGGMKEVIARNIQPMRSDLKGPLGLGDGTNGMIEKGCHDYRYRQSPGTYLSSSELLKYAIYDCLTVLLIDSGNLQYSIAYKDSYFEHTTTQLLGKRIPYDEAMMIKETMNTEVLSKSMTVYNMETGIIIDAMIIEYGTYTIDYNLMCMVDATGITIEDVNVIAIVQGNRIYIRRCSCTSKVYTGISLPSSRKGIVELAYKLGAF